MTSELKKKDLVELDEKLSKAYKKGVDAVKEELMRFVEECVPYE
jgi:hypothetical protein